MKKKKAKTFKYDDSVVKLFKDFYITLRKAGYHNIHFIKDRTSKQ